MSFNNFLEKHSLILTECAISERLRRLPGVELHPTLFNTPLIYEATGKQRLEEIYSSYITVAKDVALPILLCAPTWRVDRGRIKGAGVPLTINRDAVGFMNDLKNRYSSECKEIMAGALIAPKNDCYAPEAALSRNKASEFHSWQIEELAQTDAEVIIAQTMPALTEALGMAARLAESGKPYVISFVINRQGNVLDGTPLSEAMDRIDQSASLPPSGYMVNCVYPTFIDPASKAPRDLIRLIGIQANASSKDHEQLDGSEELQQDPLQEWGEHMIRVHQEYDIKILGGCCGTDDRHLRYLTNSISA